MPQTDSELAALRRKVYGPSPAPAATDAEIERLRQLEGRGVDDEAALPEGPGAVEPVQALGPTPDEKISPDGNRFGWLSWRGWLLVSGAAVALALIAFGLGAAVFAPRPPATLPEFSTGQSDEDLIPSEFLLGDQSLDSTSTRFLARIDGYDVFLAQPADYEGVCVVTYRVDSAPATTTSIGCAAGSGTTGGGVGVTERLEITYGDQRLPVDGTPIRLSESVTAYQR